LDRSKQSHLIFPAASFDHMVTIHFPREGLNMKPRKHAVKSWGLCIGLLPFAITQVLAGGK